MCQYFLPPRSELSELQEEIKFEDSDESNNICKEEPIESESENENVSDEDHLILAELAKDRNNDACTETTASKYPQKKHHATNNFTSNTRI